jgi:hypothetical protein
VYLTLLLFDYEYNNVLMLVYKIGLSEVHELTYRCCKQNVVAIISSFCSLLITFLPEGVGSEILHGLIHKNH